jgi:hypothetical protein
MGVLTSLEGFSFIIAEKNGGRIAQIGQTEQKRLKRRYKKRIGGKHKRRSPPQPTTKPTPYSKEKRQEAKQVKVSRDENANGNGKMMEWSTGVMAMGK